MGKTLLVLILIIVSKTLSQDFFKAANDQFDVLIREFSLSPATNVDFWDCPTAKTFENNPNLTIGNILNGWGGAQAVMSAIINFENTKNEKYYNLFGPDINGSWSNWLINNSQWSERWGTTHLNETGGTTNGAEEMIVDWSDDSGWLICIYYLVYKYSGYDNFLDSSYGMLIDVDQKYGVDFPSTTTDSRLLKYKFNKEYCKVYMLTNIIGALELYKEFTMLGSVDNLVKARKCLDIAQKYYRFTEKYLNSDGSLVTPDGYKFKKGQYAYEYKYNSREHGVWAKNENVHRYFTFAQMAGASIEALFLNLINSKIMPDDGINHYRLLIEKSDFFIENCIENSAYGDILVNSVDPNVNVFCLYWWNKYIVPINSKKYGDVILNTAVSIIDNYGTANIISSCWKGPYLVDPSNKCNCVNSSSIFMPTFDKPTKDFKEEFVWHGSANSVVASAAYIKAFQISKKESYIPSSENTSSLYISSTEITEQEYVRIMNDDPYDYQFGVLPVTNITYYDAILYCNKRSKLEGLDSVYTYDSKKSPKIDTDGSCFNLINLMPDHSKNGYRLPNRQEWVHAYLGSKQTSKNDEYFWPKGANPIHYAHFSKKSVQPVGILKPNGYGLYDMAGNVSEWIEKDETGFIKTNGSFANSIKNLKYDYHNESGRFMGSNYNGFRVVRYAPAIH